MKNCENCGEEHNGSYGSGRFCSEKCSRGFSTKSKRKEINKKVSKKLSKEPYKKVCPNCGETFKTKKKGKIYCSITCSNIYRGGWCNHKSVNWPEVNKKSYENGNNYVAGGTTKWYDYKDIRVQGTYELRTCKILDNWKDKGLIKDWEYTNDKVTYIGEDNKKHTYLIDFKIFNLDESIEYLETKGYHTTTDLLKWKAVRDKGYKLTVWYDEDIVEQELIIEK